MESLTVRIVYGCIAYGPIAYVCALGGYESGSLSATVISIHWTAGLIFKLRRMSDVRMFMSVLCWLTIYKAVEVKLYGGRNDVLSVDSVENLGFTLPHTSVSSKNIPLSSDVIFVNLYSSILCFLYCVFICILTIWYYRPSSPAKIVIDKLVNSSQDLTYGIRITTITVLVLEFICRLASCSVWTQNINNASVIVWVVWMPQIHLFAVVIFQIVFMGVYVTYKESSRDNRCHFFDDLRIELNTFSNFCATVFGLLYMLFPTIILMFAYPSQMTVIFTSVTAYMFATSIFTSSILKLTKSTKHDQDQQKNWKHVLCHFISGLLIFIALWLIILYLHMLVIFVSYPLLIGRGSVINTAPLFLISLLPSALLSGGAWLLKRFAFNHSRDEDLSSVEEGKK